MVSAPLLRARVRSLALVEIGELPPGLLEQAAGRVAPLLGLEISKPTAPLDPSFAYDASRGQYLAAALLARLHGCARPETVVLGVASVDLFLPVLTFVFGEAEMPGRAAVFSIHRLREEFYGLPPDAGLLAARAVKEMLHELGHTFGLAHCPDYACAMKSSHSVEAVDIKGDVLCRACREKLGRRPA
jgi:archaemetzincin